MEPSDEVEINEDKLKRKVSQQKIWDFFGITSQQYSQLSLQEKTTMLRKYCSANLNNCGVGKFFFSCSLIFLAGTQLFYALDSFFLFVSFCRRSFA